MKKVVFGALAVVSVACGTAATSSDSTQSTAALRPRAAACTPDSQPSIWHDSFAQPLKPPRYAAGLDLAVTDDYQLMTLDGVQQALCAGTLIPDSDPQSTDDNYSWGTGDNPPFQASFDKTTHKMTSVAFGDGYTGTIEWKSRTGGTFGDHTYSAKVGDSIQRDGAPFVIDWTNQDAADKAATELFDGLVATFAPSLPGESVNCRTSQHCLLTHLDTGDAIFGARDVHFYFHFPAAATDDGGVNASAPPLAQADYFYMLPAPAGYTPPPPPPANP
jgi:hypothetical protein